MTAAQEQLEAIRQLDVEGLPAKLQEIAALRMRHPALSLTDLAARCRPPITKAAAHHRMANLKHWPRWPSLTAELPPERVSLPECDNRGANLQRTARWQQQGPANRRFPRAEGGDRYWNV